MNEFDLIRKLTASLAKNAGVVVGPGDDCAVLDVGILGWWLLLKTDALVEGVHFEPDADPLKVGHKALARCLSDVAAMSGIPLNAVVTLGLPGEPQTERLERIYQGMEETARAFDVSIVGGETTHSPGQFFISVSLVGRVEPGRCVLRSTAQVGDAVFVTGELGGSILGRHLEFQPRLVESRWLTEQFQIHSMIDLSDGLGGDLRHILNASGVGAELLAEAIPVSKPSKRMARTRASLAVPSPSEAAAEGAAVSARTALSGALGDGEDYELLFTLASRDAVALLDRWKSRFPGTRLSCVGKLVAQEGVRIRGTKGVQPLQLHGYDHFQKS
jgi:thiamine-monophosphate kinase